MGTGLVEAEGLACFSEVESYTEGSLKPDRSQLRSQINKISIMMRGNKQKSIPDQSSPRSTSPWASGDKWARAVVLDLWPPDLLGLQLPEILARRGGGVGFWEL